MGVGYFYNYLFHELGDQRFKDNPLTDTPWLMFAILILYWYFAKVWGPKFMKNREPYKIEWVMTIYNVTQVIWNFYVFSMMRCGYHMVMRGKIEWTCLPLDMTASQIGLYSRSMVVAFFYNKIFDLMDTVFMVLRRKNGQISQLHLNHHMIMVVGIWFGLKYAPGGNVGYLGFMNCLIHVMLYAYYQLALMGFDMTKWKRILTKLQMTQFALDIFIISFVFFDNHCKNNILFSILAIFLAMYFIHAFALFYIKNYMRSPEKEIEYYKSIIKERTEKNTNKKVKLA